MPIKLETFISLSSIAWSAISSIATVLAVIVALFLPFYYEKKKKTNLSKLIENEIRSNIDLLQEANSTKEGIINGRTTSRLNLMCPKLVHLSLNIWNDNKQTIAEITAKKFLKYSEIANFLERIKLYAVEIEEKKGQSPYAAFIEDEIVKCLQLSNKEK